jgi:hypothetical protein
VAKLTFNIEELVEVVNANGLLPPEIIRLRAKGEKIHFVIRTGSFILPYIPASARYVSFDGDNAIFELTVVSAHANKAVGWLNELVKVKMPDHTKVEYPHVTVEINRLLEDENVKNLRVKDIRFEDGRFTIISGST